jgi:hypothetical protein
MLGGFTQWQSSAEHPKHLLVVVISIDYYAREINSEGKAVRLGQRIVDGPRNPNGQTCPREGCGEPARFANR